MGPARETLPAFFYLSGKRAATNSRCNFKRDDLGAEPAGLRLAARFAFAQAQIHFNDRARIGSQTGSSA